MIRAPSRTRVRGTLAPARRLVPLVPLLLVAGATTTTAQQLRGTLEDGVRATALPTATAVVPAVQGALATGGSNGTGVSVAADNAVALDVGTTGGPPGVLPGVLPVTVGGALPGTLTGILPGLGGSTSVGVTIGQPTGSGVGAGVTIGGGIAGGTGSGAGTGSGTGAGVGAGTGTIGADALSALELRLTRAVEAIPVRGNDAAGRGAPTASGTDSLAAGHGSRAAAPGSVAVGPGATADGAGGVALGSQASAGQANAVAVGAGARTTRAGQVVLGTAQNTVTLPGLGSDASRAAQAGETRFVTADAGGNLATSLYGPGTIAGLGGRLDLTEGRLTSAESRLGGVESRVGAVESRVGTVEARVDALGRTTEIVRREARQGIAAAMAMTSASMPSAPGRTTWVANTATYRGEWAGGLALAHRLPTAVPLAITAGYAYGGDNSHGVRAGLGGEF